MPSIVKKLKRFNTMQLSNIQDLGGCRAVMRNMRKVDEMVDLWTHQKFSAFELDREKSKDYIAHPKDDGYRGVHLIYRYCGDSQNGAFKGLRIEVQIRSRLQHSWATAVETIDAFTGQGLKSNIGEEPWKRFFVIVAALMAWMEKRAEVPGVVPGPELEAEFIPLCERLHIPEIFVGLSAGFSLVLEMPKGVEACILQMDSKERKTRTRGFQSNKEAEQALLEAEKENLDKPHIQTVMASAQNLRNLKRAYPSYYADTNQFVGAVEGLLAAMQETQK